MIPVFELRTAPRPETRTVKRKIAGAKNAETFAPGATVTLQPADPTQGAPQRTSLAPGPGVAVNARRVPEFHVVAQVCAHCNPGTSAVTDPEPDTDSARGAWLSSRTSHAESCVSSHAPPWP